MKVATNFITEINGCKIWIRREDEFGEGIKGNKYRKLKYNILKAKTNNSKGIITFGGAFSNHLFATAAQALEFRRPNKFSSAIEKTLTLVRENVKKLEQDRILSTDIEIITGLIENQAFNVYPEL